MTRCPHCHLEVIRGRDDTGSDVTLDAAPLNPMGELGAVLTGRGTWTVHQGGRLIAYRTPHAMRHRPAGTTARQSVHPGHHCSAYSQP